MNSTVRRRLEEAVAILAAGPAKQEQYLRRLGVWPQTDELALQFDNVYRAAIAPSDQPRLTDAALRRLSTLNRDLDEMSGSAKSDLWLVPALRSSGEWKRVRAAAAETLSELRQANRELRYRPTSTRSVPRGSLWMSLALGMVSTLALLCLAVTVTDPSQVSFVFAEYLLFFLPAGLLIGACVFGTVVGAGALVGQRLPRKQRILVHGMSAFFASGVLLSVFLASFPITVSKVPFALVSAAVFGIAFAYRSARRLPRD